jgi:hypothetical protein
MVPARTTRPALARGAPKLSVELVKRAGHLAFPKHFTLGQSAEPGLEEQCLAWLRNRG